VELEMNEQFRKLLSQATELADEEYGYDGSDYAEIVQEKFAELIVRECASLAYDGPSGILDYFGVEE
jgi:hypothetical protein